MTVRTLSGTYAAGYTVAGGVTVVDVTARALIEGGGLSAMARMTVDNSGQISAGGGTGANGISLHAGGVVTNESGATASGGQGSAGLVGGVGIALSAASTVSNYGQVTGGQGGRATGGVAGAGGAGIDMFGGVILNDGVIAGGAGAPGASAGTEGDGVLLSRAGTIANGDANHTSALIKGGAGIWVSGATAATITNFGTIEGTGGTAVQLAGANDLLLAEAGSTFIGALAGDGGVLRLLAGAATGTIDGINSFRTVGFAAGGDWLFEGADTISGGLTVAGGGTVEVGGTLTGGGGGSRSVVLATGLDRLIVDSGSMLIGIAVGDGASSTLDLAARAGTISNLGGTGTLSGGGTAAASGTFTGFGAYQVESATTWTLAGDSALKAGQSLVADGAVYLVGGLTNAGVVQGGAAANAIGGNYGGAGVIALQLLRGGTLSNGGGVIGGAGGDGGGQGGYGYGGGVGGSAIKVAAGASVSNQVAITGGGGGAGFGGGNYVFAGAGGGGGAGAAMMGGFLDNLGAITGGAGGGGGDGSLSAGLGGAGGAGLVLSVGTLVNTGTLIGGTGGNGGSGGYAGNGGAGGAGVVVFAGATFNNSGYAEGGRGGRGGAGTSLGGSAGTGGAGLTAYGPGTFLNSGYLLGGAGGGSGYGGAGNTGDGADILGGGLLINGSATDAAALIQGRIGVYALWTGSATIVNYASMEGGAYAVKLGASSDRLVAEAGSDFDGLILGGGGALETTSGSMSVDDLGAYGTLTGAASGSFSGFGAYFIDTAAEWTLTGVDLVDEGKTVAVAGTLTVAGSLTNSGVIVGASGASAVSVTVGGNVVNDGAITGGRGLDGSQASPNGGGGGAGATASAGGIGNYGVIIGGQGGAGASGIAGSGGSGGDGLDSSSGVILLNGLGAVLMGGSGGVGGRGGSVGAAGGVGGVGAGLVVGQAGLTLFAAGTIVGGDGGSGGYGQIGGVGGAGGCGLALSGGGTFFDKLSTITGGRGGDCGGQGGAGGVGGVGVQILSGGELINRAIIVGGQGGAGSGKGLAGAQGAGISLLAGGTVVNGSSGAPVGLIEGYIGVYAVAGAAATITNFATIQGSAYSVVLNGASDLLNAEQGAVFLGTIRGGGGTLNLVTGSGSVTGLGAIGTFAGGESGVFVQFGTYEFSSGAWTLGGGNTIGAGQALIDDSSVTVAGVLSEAAGGAVNIGFNQTLILAGNETVGGAIGGSGSVSLVGGAVSFMAGAALSMKQLGQSGGAVSVAGNLLLSEPWLQTGGSVAVGAGSTLSLTGGASSFGGTLSGRGMLAFVGGTQTLAAGAVVSIAGWSISEPFGGVTVAGTLNYGGLFTEAAGASVTVSGGGSLALTGQVSLAGQITGAGSLSISGSNLTLSAGANLSLTQSTVNVSTVNASGTLVNGGTVGLTSANFTVLASGVSLAGGGTWALSNQASNQVVGATAGALLTNIDNTLTGAGDLGGGQMTLTNRALGVINGNKNVALVVDTGGNSITNAGLIEATGSGGVIIQSAVNNGGTLAANGGNLTVNGAVANTGLMVVNAGTLAIAGSVSGGGTIQADGGLLAIGGAISGATIVLGAGAVNFNSGAALIKGQFNQSAGVVAVNATSALDCSWLQTGGSVAVGAGSTLSLTGGASSFGGTLSGRGMLAFVGGTQTLAAGAVVSIAGWSISEPFGGVTVAGTLNYGGLFTEAAGASVTVSGGGSLALTGQVSLAGQITGAGSLSISGSNLILSDGVSFSDATVSISSATVSASGGIGIGGSLTVASGNVVIGAGGAVLTGGGTINLTDQASNRIIGANAATTLTNFSDTLTGAGQLGGGQMVLINKSGGVIEATGADALIIDTGANSIINAGLIDSIGSGGLTIQSAISNAGTLETDGGDLIVNGAVTGTSKGLAVINAGTLDFASSFSQGVLFGAGGGVLELSQSQSFNQSVTGFSQTGGTVFDLNDIAFNENSQASYIDNGQKTGGVLVVTDGIHTARITLVGDYSRAVFNISGDGQGGVLVSDTNSGAAEAHSVESTPAARVNASKPVSMFVASMSMVAVSPAHSWAPATPTSAFAPLPTLSIGASHESFRATP